MAPEAKKSILVRITESLNARLEDQAVRLQSNKNALIKLAIVRFIEDEEKRAKDAA